MRQLIAILSNHDHWHAYPIMGQHDSGDTYLFLDHHIPITERATLINDVAAKEGITEVVRVVLEPPVLDCEAGVHDWRLIERNGHAVDAQCHACREVVHLSMPLHIVQATHASV